MDGEAPASIVAKTELRRLRVAAAYDDADQRSDAAEQTYRHRQLGTASAHGGRPSRCLLFLRVRELAGWQLMSRFRGASRSAKCGGEEVKA